MSQRFEGIPESTKDAMTDAEVREVIARLSEERVAPKVGDVASIAGASEADVRRVLEELRSEQALKAAAEAQRQAPAESNYTSPFLMGRRNQMSPHVTIKIAIVLITLGLLLLIMGRSSVGPGDIPPPPDITAPTAPVAPRPTPGG